MKGLYERWFDRPGTDVHIDASAVDWVREHRPRQWRRLASATHRNARRLRQVAWIQILMGTIMLIQTFWLAGIMRGADLSLWPLVVLGLAAGFCVGNGWGTFLMARSSDLLAMLRGETARRDSWL